MYKIDYLGRTMAVKIKRPDADILIATDFHIIKKVAQFIDQLGILLYNYFIHSSSSFFCLRIYINSMYCLITIRKLWVIEIG